VVITLKVTAGYGSGFGSKLKDYGNDGGKPKGLDDLTTPDIGGETCYTNSSH
jgi:hypothetical protein